MSKICIKELQPGKVAAVNVTTSDGRVLLAKGCMIEPWHITLLMGLGIADIEVEDTPDSQLMNQALEYVREFFAFVDPDNPAIVEMYTFAVGLVARRLADGWKLPSLSERRATNVEHLSDVFPMEIVSPDRIVTHETSLASFPDVYFKLQEEINSHDVSVGRVASLVSQDVSLTAKLLKLTNSPLYGFSETVESIDRAISVIGMNELSTLALGISAISYFQGIPPELIDMESFWHHSLSCGIFASILAKSLRERNAERFFIAGLLHDAGRLILFKEMPYASSDAMLFARENVLPLVEAEQAVFNFTHTTVSEHLLRQWKFPKQLSDLINFHHDPLAAPQPRDAAIVHVADLLAHAVDIAAGGMYVLPTFEEKAWDLLGISVDSINQIGSDFEIQAGKMIKAFF